MASLKHRRGADAVPSTTTTTTSTSGHKPVVLIVGAGPCGASIAKSLAEKNVYQVKLVEAYAHPDTIDKDSPKAYVISLRSRGQRNLRSTTGVEPQDVKQAVISHHMVFHPSNKIKETETPSLVAPRQVLASHLLDQAQAAGVEILFEHKLVNVDFDQRVAEFQTTKSQVVHMPYDLLVGCDGSNSKVRTVLDEFAEDFRVERLAVDSMEYQVAVLEVNPFAQSHPAGASHVWNNKAYNSICLAFPLVGNKLLFAIVFPEGKLAEFQSKPGGYDDAFEKLFPDVSDTVKAELARKLSVGTPANGGTCVWTSSLGSVQHGVALVGDSAHGMWPSLGQGCNCALESAAVFCNTIDELTGFAMDDETSMATWAGMLVKEFNQRRFADARAAVDLTYGGLGARTARGRQNAPLSYKLQIAGIMLLHKMTAGLIPKPALLRLMTDDDISYSTARRFNFYYEKIICFGTLALCSAGVYWWKQSRS